MEQKLIDEQEDYLVEEYLLEKSIEEMKGGLDG